MFLLALRFEYSVVPPGLSESLVLNAVLLVWLGRPDHGDLMDMGRGDALAWASHGSGRLGQASDASSAKAGRTIQMRCGRWLEDATANVEAAGGQAITNSLCKARVPAWRLQTISNRCLASALAWHGRGCGMLASCRGTSSPATWASGGKQRSQMAWAVSASPWQWL